MVGDVYPLTAEGLEGLKPRKAWLGRLGRLGGSVFFRRGVPISEGLEGLAGVSFSGVDLEA